MTQREREAFEKLLGVCRRLRGPDGCPWDQKQTLESMTPYLVEEAVETGEAIALNDDAKIAEELGDMTFLSVFCLELLAARGKTDLAAALEQAADKLIRRHPHVYGDVEVKDGDAAYRQWQQIKQVEQGTRSLLGESPKGLPALVAAFRVQEKAAAVGFDWVEHAGALDKVREEFDEIAQAIDARTAKRRATGPKAHPDDVAAAEPSEADRAIAREIGDVLFAIANVSRRLGIDPELELRSATHRFRDRFHHIENRLAERGASPASATLEEMDVLWEEAKTIARAKEAPTSVSPTMTSAATRAPLQEDTK